MPAKPKTIDEYLAAIPKEQRAALRALREAINAIIPKAEECISDSLPAVRVDGRIVAGFQATRSARPNPARTVATRPVRIGRA